LAFLLRTQAADGTWHVPSRLHDPARLSPDYFESGYPYGHDQFISIAGAAWAIMALAESLPQTPSPPALSSGLASSLSVEPWIEQALFGSVADLEALLDGGLSPNAATASGRTSLLMMAANDVAKTRLLLERGAQVNVRAASGFTPLMAAARDARSSAAVDLLLEHGAEVSARAPLDPYPLAVAAGAGNSAVLARLHRAGDSLNAPYRQSRFGPPTTPMAKAIRNGELAVVRALLDLGADVHTLDGPWSPLDSAVHNNRVDLARLFIDRGADVNAVDKVGYTPLLLAAAIDFGDTDMIDVLLAAGADPHVKTPSGKTALDLAREYGHARFIPRLQAAMSRPARTAVGQRITQVIAVAGRRYP
jgi:ankyrin repeat protein